MPRNNGKTSPAVIAATKKQAQAVELRLAHRTYAEIAEVVGYASAGSAYGAVKAALRKTLEPGTVELRGLMLERHNVILRTWWPRMLAMDVDAARLCLKAMEGIRGLMNLDIAPPAVTPIINMGVLTMQQLVMLATGEEQQ